MKIAIIAPYWNPPHFVGGISRVIYALRSAWTANGHLVHVFAANTRPEPLDGIYRLPCPRLPLRTLWNSLYLRVAGDLRPYDVVFPQTGVSALFSNPAQCVPCIHTLTNVEDKGKLRPWRFFHDDLESAALNRMTYAVTISEEVREALISRYRFHDRNVLCTKNGVDTEWFTSSAPVPEHDVFTVFSAGRLIPRKRFDLLLRAFALLHSTNPTARLRIAGEGPQRSFLEGLARTLGISHRIAFLGQLDTQHLIHEFRGSSVFALASEAEGMPMILLEAMAMSMPVVVAGFPGVKSIVSHGEDGLVVTSSDPTRWAQTLVDVCDKPALGSSLGARARTKVERHFSWESTAEEILRFFQEVRRHSGALVS